MVLGLLWCNVGIANFNPLPLKTGENYRLYNAFIKDYNSIKSEWESEVKSYCENVFVQGGGFHLLVDYVNCNYRSAGALLEKYNLRFKESQKILYRWYQEYYTLTKATAIRLMNRDDRNVRRDWAYKSVELEKNMFRNLDRVMEKKALHLNERDIAKRNEIKKNIKKKKDEEAQAKKYWWLVILIILGTFFIYKQSVRSPSRKKNRKS